ncbi:hypothetical protein M758_6G060300 [Ceratodon purpureus]|nr:hypothetical protein M758_6G060300 [Ceratodon purpureus]
MQEGEWVQVLGRVYEFAFGEMPSSSSSSQSYAASVGVGVAVTAVAGVAVAAAVGGLIYYNGGEFPFDLPFSTRRSHSPLTQEKWVESFDSEDGRLLDGEKVIYKVRGGGIVPSIRAQVWPFLLGVYELDSSSAERVEVKFAKHEEYEELRTQCVKASETLKKPKLVEAASEPEGEKVEEDGTEGEAKGDTASDDVPSGRKIAKEEEDFQTWQRIIKLDAVRMNAEWIPYAETQASVTFEEAEKLSKEAGLMDDDHLEPPRRHHAARLVLILEAYTMYDPETGYCQGMSDLLSPFVALIDHDYEAFWCFVKFMEFARHNFRLDEVGIRRQLNMVSSIIKSSDPQLYRHLRKLGCEDCTFIYRMVVVLMRRELSFEQTLCLWEVMWADWAAIDNKRGAGDGRRRDRLGPPTRDLLLYTIAAAVRKRRRNILQYSGMDELVRECNGMAGNLDIWELLADARELVRCVQVKPTKSD